MCVWCVCVCFFVFIVQGEGDVSTDDIFSRAVAGLKATMSDKLREAVEAGDSDAIFEQSSKLQYKNVFGAPKPPERESRALRDHIFVVVFRAKRKRRRRRRQTEAVVGD